MRKNSWHAVSEEIKKKEKEIKTGELYSYGTQLQVLIVDILERFESHLGTHEIKRKLQ